MRIALLEDDEPQAQLVQLWLTDAGYHVDWFVFARRLLDAAEERDYALFVLDWLVPGMKGIEVVKRLRQAGCVKPVLFLTQFDSSENAADAIKAGASDYMVKTAMHRLLVARVRALLVDTPQASPPDIEVGRYKTDARNHGVIVAGSPVWLGPADFELARYLLAHHERLVTRNELRRNAWHRQDKQDTTPRGPIEVKVRDLVAKLELDGRHGLRMTEVHRLGFRMECAAVG